MKILVISLAGIGDTIFATPLIHELRLNFPEAQIEALVLWRGARDVLENNPYLNRVHQKNLIAASKFDSLGFLLKLRRERYDVSINTFPQSRRHYRLIAKIIGAKIRISHEYDCSGALDQLLVNKSLAQDYSRHAVENNLALLPLIGARSKLERHDYEIFLTDTEKKWAENFIFTNKVSGRTLFGIHVGSGGTKNLALRRWPLENFIELVRHLQKEHQALALLFFGGPEEKSDHEKIRAVIRGDNLFFPETENIRQAAALVGKCKLFLSVDTSLMHVAAAMKVPKQIVIETPTWNKPIEPNGNQFTLVRNPAVAGRNLDFYRYDGRDIRGSAKELMCCMKSVSVRSVIEALRPGFESVRAEI
ncbi:MAG TPA: glycosyltransferase family 9 protein [Verrucomicrobiae bacterium]|nr:glycosyltransferase family 9 protein [Verrucomicrobiae bacterium]